MVFVCCLVLSSVMVKANRDQEFTTIHTIFIVINMVWEFPVRKYLFTCFSHLFNDSLPFWIEIIFKSCLSYSVEVLECPLYLVILNSITSIPLPAFNGSALNLYCKGSLSTRKRINLQVLFRILMVATLPPTLSPKLKNIYKYSYS